MTNFQWEFPISGINVVFIDYDEIGTHFTSVEQILWAKHSIFWMVEPAVCKPNYLEIWIYKYVLCKYVWFNIKSYLLIQLGD